MIPVLQSNAASVSGAETELVSFTVPLGFVLELSELGFDAESPESVSWSIRCNKKPVSYMSVNGGWPNPIAVNLKVGGGQKLTISGRSSSGAQVLKAAIVGRLVNENEE